MKQNKPPFFHLAFLFLLVVLVGYLYYLFINAQAIASKLQAEVDSISSNQAKLQNLSTSTPLLSQEISVWSKSLPASEDDVATFASFLDQLAKSNNLLISIHFGDFPNISDVSGSKMTTLPLDISLDGSFQNVTHFIAQLSSSSYFYKIDKLSLSRRDVMPGTKTSIVGLLIMSTN